MFKSKTFFYKTKENYEVDFLLHENPIQLIQISYTMITAGRKKRALGQL